MRILQLTLLITIILSSCESELKNEKDGFIVESIPIKSDHWSAYNVIYDNNACLDWSVETLPMIDVEFDTISLNERIKGRVFFSSNYLRRLALCNNLYFEMAFDIFNDKGKTDTSIVESQRDTIYFKVPYNSLKLITSTKKLDEYLFKGNLRATYYKGNAGNEASRYDTLMPINERICVLKNGRNK